MHSKQTIGMTSKYSESQLYLWQIKASILVVKVFIGILPFQWPSKGLCLPQRFCKFWFCIFGPKLKRNVKSNQSYTKWHVIILLASQKVHLEVPDWIDSLLFTITNSETAWNQTISKWFAHVPKTHWQKEFVFMENCLQLNIVGFTYLMLNSGYHLDICTYHLFNLHVWPIRPSPPTPPIPSLPIQIIFTLHPPTFTFHPSKFTSHLYISPLQSPHATPHFPSLPPSPSTLFMFTSHLHTPHH